MNQVLVIRLPFRKTMAAGHQALAEPSSGHAEVLRYPCLLVHPTATSMPLWSGHYMIPENIHNRSEQAESCFVLEIVFLASPNFSM